MPRCTGLIEGDRPDPSDGVGALGASMVLRLRRFEPSPYGVRGTMSGAFR